MIQTTRKQKPKAYVRSPLKWPGGKFRDLNELVPLIPAAIGTFVDPFAGGCSLPLNVEAERYALGDIDHDLINFLSLRGAAFDRFSALIAGIERARQDAGEASLDAKNFASTFIPAALRCMRHIDHGLRRNEVIRPILEAERARRLLALTRLAEARRTPAPGYARTAIYAAIYYIIRDAYNSPRNETGVDTVTRVATWYALRELAHGGMMRYSRAGKFNTAYGGLTYNTKSLLAKRNNIIALCGNIGNRSTLTCGDFRTTITQAAPGPDDFVFLDPPYERAFKGVETRRMPTFRPYVPDTNDGTTHEDVFTWLAEHGPGTRWMLVERVTPWVMDHISALRGRGQTIKTHEYDHHYSANIKGRNDREARHIVVTNYR